MARLSDRQRKQIENKFEFSTNERFLIRQYKGEWEHEKLEPLIRKIRKHYLNEQGELCSFCRLPFREDIQVEHFVPKAGKYGRPEFTFYAQNLSVACKHCNSKKSTNNDMIPYTRTPYPQSGIYFRIAHPHFDDYFEHIEIVDRSRYVGKTLKGRRTIERCKLYDPVIVGVLVKAMRYEDDPLIQGVLRIREMQGDFKRTIDRLMDRIFK
ncbi:MAG: HNH endonuclease [Bacteroidia bacterium]|nr:HNH endonuclease [Bacteroidia bacterium]